MNILSTQYSLETESFEIYLAGCNPPHCEGCFNPESWLFHAGTTINTEIIISLQNKIKRYKNIIKNIFILGGEPIHQEKQELLILANNFKETNKKLWLFTRYDIENISKDIINTFDYIKCGKFDITKLEEKKQYGIILSSENQYVISTRELRI